MSENDSMILGALNSLAVALADHDHQWTDGERAIYEEAVKLLDPDAPEISGDEESN